MIGKRKPAGAGDHGMQRDITQFFIRIPKQIGKGLPNVGEMSFVIGKQNIMIWGWRIGMRRMIR